MALISGPCSDFSSPPTGQCVFVNNDQASCFSHRLPECFCVERYKREWIDDFAVYSTGRKLFSSRERAIKTEMCCDNRDILPTPLYHCFAERYQILFGRNICGEI